MSIRLKLLSILPKLMSIGLRRFNDLLKEFPEAKTRSTLLKLYDTAGNQIAFWLGFEGDRPVVREVDPRNPTIRYNRAANAYRCVLEDT